MKILKQAFVTDFRVINIQEFGLNGHIFNYLNINNDNNNNDI